MNAELNGGPKNLPGIVVGFDPEAQQVHLKFDAKDFRTWEFVEAILDMAVEKAKQLKIAARMQAMQQAQIDQQAQQVIKNGLVRGR